MGNHGDEIRFHLVHFFQGSNIVQDRDCAEIFVHSAAKRGASGAENFLIIVINA